MAIVLLFLLTFWKENGHDCVNCFWVRSACDGCVYVHLVSLLPTITDAVALKITAWGMEQAEMERRKLF